jgi:glycosyltransferase involved in cell wall biosynthesis
MTIRILYLIRESFPTFRPDVTTLFAQSLPAHGVFCDLVALRESDEPETWAAGSTFTRKASSRIGRTFGRIALAFDLFALTKRNKYAAVQVRDRMFGALVGLLVARRRRIPFFYWMSFPFPDVWQDMGADKAQRSVSLLRRLYWRTKGYLSSWLLYIVVLPRATHIFVQSDVMRKVLMSRGIPDANMTSVPMGVSFAGNIGSTIPADDSRLKGRRVIMYLGALERIRHPEIMLEAMQKVLREAPDAILVLVGDSQTGGERKWLEQEIERLDLVDHAFVTGWLSPEQARRYLRVATVGLSPFPRNQVFDMASPTKVCEFLAYGVPVVANDQPDQATLLQDTGGGICVPFTAEGFANGILELLSDPLRAESMATLGQAKIAKLRGYNVLGESLARRYREIFRKPFAS